MVGCDVGRGMTVVMVSCVSRRDGGAGGAKRLLWWVVTEETDAEDIQGETF